MAREEYNEFAHLRLLSQIGPNDNDVFALKADGTILQKRVAFNVSGAVTITWVPFIPSADNGYCQAWSPRYDRLINDEWQGDPRTAAGGLASTYGGNPEERRS